MKNKYELLFVIKSGATEAAREKSINKYVTIIEKSGGSITLIDRWGNRRFAYPIDFKLEGFYVLIYFDAKATLPAELERVMRISDDIVRFMVVNRNGMGEPSLRRKKDTTKEVVPDGQGQAVVEQTSNASPIEQQPLQAIEQIDTTVQNATEQVVGVVEDNTQTDPQQIG